MMVRDKQSLTVHRLAIGQVIRLKGRYGSLRKVEIYSVTVTFLACITTISKFQYSDAITPMAEEHVQRRLAAIAIADVVGYSRLMEADEAGTLAALKERRTTILQPTVRAHGGRIAKVMGDGVLIEFASAFNAVTAAIELQNKMAEANADLPEAQHIVLRIGINLGDVLIEGSDLYGDGINVAARLESLAGPGDIYVSRSVHDQVNRKLASSFDDLGPKALKNIAEPVRVYRVNTVVPR